MATKCDEVLHESQAVIGALPESSFAGGASVREGAQSALPHLLSQPATHWLCGDSPHPASSLGWPGGGWGEGVKHNTCRAAPVVWHKILCCASCPCLVASTLHFFPHTLVRSHFSILIFLYLRFGAWVMKQNFISTRLQMQQFDLW